MQKEVKISKQPVLLVVLKQFQHLFLLMLLLHQKKNTTKENKQTQNCFCDLAVYFSYLHMHYFSGFISYCFLVNSHTMLFILNHE